MSQPHPIQPPDEPIRVEVTRRAPGEPPPTTLEEDLRTAQVVADWLDTKFTLGGVRFGLDSLVGLIPVVGDTVTTIVGLYPLLLARKHKLGRWVQARMLGNLAVDWVVGLVPLAGDVFDIGYKANLRNFQLLQRAARK